MRAGALRGLVTFQRRGAVDDGYGNSVSGAFVDVFSCPAEVAPKLGGEAVLASRLQGTQVYLVRVHDVAQTQAVTPDWRIVNLRTGQVLNIRTNVALTERRGWRELTCEEGVAT